MHPRNPYRHPPDFRSLAEFSPLLKPYLSTSSGKHTIDFGDPGAQRALTQALLERDYNLTLILPDDRLCPPVPNRLNYILWIQDILFPCHDMSSDQEIKGLDIGTGASAIYPLLACSQPNAGKWTFVATEIDPLSANFASRNVEANNLQSRITIWPPQRPSSPKGLRPAVILIPLVEDSRSLFDFTMCNPPFYGSWQDIESSAEAKDMPPRAVCTGAETEMITPGGETAFVLQMLRESAREDVRGRCRWFTSMLGKLSSVGEIVAQLRSLKIDNYALTQFIQGTTRRWAVAWSFGDERLPDTIARPSVSSLSSYLPATTTLRQTFEIAPWENTLLSSDHVPPAPHERLNTTLLQVLTSIEGVSPHCVVEKTKALPVDELWTIDVTAAENTWSRAARRKRKRQDSSPVGHIQTTPGQRQAQRSGRGAASAPSPQGRIHKTDAGDAAALDLPSHALAAGLHCRITAFPTAPAAPAPPQGRDPPVKPDPGPSSSGVVLEAQWVRGWDRSLFEGFWSHVCRKVRDGVGGAKS